MRAWLLLIAAILGEVAGSLSLKGALQHPGLYGLVAAAYLTSFVCLALVLRAGLGLGVAYGIWGATGVALTAIGSALLFDEAITPVMVVGMVLIMVGVVVVEAGAQRAASAEPAS